MGIKDVKISLDHPAMETHGDYSTNVAMTICANKELRIKNQEWKNPLELARKIVGKCIIHDSPFMIHFEKVEAVKPGFINFWLSKEYLIDELAAAVEKKDGFGRTDILKGKKIMVEFTDPNPFKEFHIGHLYSNAVGESVSRLLEAMGANLKRANYQGDVGMHVAKALYGIQNSKFKIQSLEDKSLKEKIKTLGEAYALGAKMYEDDKTAKSKIEKINKQVYAKDPEIMPLYEKGRAWSLEYFETIYKRLGTKFDFYYFESEVGIDGLKLVKEYLEKGVFEESQNAIIFPGEKYGLHNRVFINSLGLPTYEAKDLGLAFKKYDDFKYDQSISVTGNEIIEYFKVILIALKQINPEIAVKIKHLSHGMARVAEGKMSSRSGNIISGEWLLDEAKKKIEDAFSSMDEKTAEQVAVGAVKYSLLKSDVGQDIQFIFDESISLQGNSGPYLQYTYARTQSVLAKTGIKNYELRIMNELESEETVLLRFIYRFPEVVEEAAENFSPNILCNYLFDLTQKFNLFYEKHKILGSKNEGLRLALTQAVGIAIKNGLNLLGIQAPEKM